MLNARTPRAASPTRLHDHRPIQAFLIGFCNDLFDDELDADGDDD